jgi:diguanylate cyclase (GGDEF)-like protein
MWAVVLGGLALIWIVLFPLVRQTTRTLDRQQARLRDQSRHDALTGLPNRVALHEALAEAVAAGGAALLLVDLDRFREINDTLGHEHGDELLLRAAQRLESMVRRTDVVARLGGDEFAVLRRGTVTEGEARALGALLTRSLRQPLDIRGTTVAVDASIGFALCPAHADEPMTMLRRAEVAMYQAKRRRSGVEGYEPDRDPAPTRPPRARR